MSVSIGDLVLSLAALPPLLASAYLSVLAVVARRSPAPAAPAQWSRIRVVVPAHDEENGIAETIRSLLAVDYPRERFAVLVIADNCSDRTADLARQMGVDVLERREPARRGKGHALRFAFDHLLARGEDDAVAVIDADTIVSPDLLKAFAARLCAGASAVQARYSIRNATDSWRTRLLVVAFSAIHRVRSLARERLRLSCGLRGNGMCFSAELLRRVPHDACSLVEDVEYGIELGRAGYRVEYVDEAEVRGLVPATEHASRSQRRRWERGRRQIARRYAWPLFRSALRERSLVQADLLADLLVPPLATLATWSVAGLAACALFSELGGRPAVAERLFGGAFLALAVYVLRGWMLSGAGARGLAALAFAPVYVGWKVMLMVVPSRENARDWVRTRRAEED